ncbi:MAG: hypothetical protein JNM93_10565 [Bacteriovoracaceae bacterium]|nr:hypothetical protein [Bacteriovoracaceae bacterium]
MVNLVSNSKGQSLVEYILLMVLVSIVFTVIINSQIMTNLLSDNGSLIQNTKSTIEFNYRHGHSGFDALGSGTNTTDYNAANHASYSLSNGTYFFAPAEAYP